jgi:DNA-binding PadR family transcriptional regulator
MADSGLNPTAAALLGLLHEGPMTGGQLMSAAQRRLGPYWSMTRSQVYRELPALAEAGFVKLGKPGARSSQPYSITPAGKRAFVRWLGEPSSREVLRSPLALRVAFGAHQSAAQLQQAYTEASEYHTAALAEAREQSKESKKTGDEFGSASLELAAAYHRAALAWLKNAPGKQAGDRA